MDIPEKALSARLIATPMLNEAAINQLLNSQLCIDVGFHQVKIYPDELAPFLAAQRLASLVESADQALKLVQNFTWVAPSGEQGVHREYLPLMGWLATLNPHCRAVILRYDPQALAFFGDLRNPSVPLADAQEALTQSIRRIVEMGDHPGRGIYTLTSENHWQAGPARLAPLISSLFDEFGEHYWAHDVLMDIATACKLDAFHAKIMRRHSQQYVRLLEDRDDVRYLLELGNVKDLAGLASAVKASQTVREGTASLLLERLGWAHFSPSEVARLIDKQFSTGNVVSAWATYWSPVVCWTRLPMSNSTNSVGAWWLAVHGFASATSAAVTTTPKPRTDSLNQSSAPLFNCSTERIRQSLEKPLSCVLCCNVYCQKGILISRTEANFERHLRRTRSYGGRCLNWWQGNRAWMTITCFCP
ncbi:hypothetical protein LP420_04870 [Massilia sp. B-10]|nr:hypothetical protein LP420_04870 [Massilia sp. B-10]